MKCVKCDTELKEDTSICPECGYDNESDEEQIVEVLDVEEKDTDDTTKDKNEELLEIYVGKDYDRLKGQFFNFFAFLFKWFYLLFKGFYITGIIGLIIFGIVIVFLRDYIWFYLAFSSGFWGFFFNRYALFVARFKLSRMKQDEDSYDIVTRPSEKGWVRFLKIFIISGLFTVATLIGLNIIPVTKYFNSKFWNNSTENLANCLSVVKAAYTGDEGKKEIGDLIDAVCRVIEGENKEYQIFMKSELNHQLIYSYFVTEDGYVSLEKNTKELESLLEKEKEGTLSEKEEEKLSTLRSIQLNYQDLYNQAKQKNNNNKEQVYYILEKNEIIR